MSVLDEGRATATGQPVDCERWPAMRPPAPTAIRSAVVRALLRRVAARTGTRIELPGGRCLGPETGPSLHVRDEPAFLARLGRDGLIGFGEAYMAGNWDSPDLVAVLEPMARELSQLVPQPLQRLRRLHDRRHPAHEGNDRAGSRRNISRHYDLSNDLFATFLDETMTYSAALWDGTPDRNEPLPTAQHRKIDRLLDTTGVGPGTSLLEIGTGWGELALRAAQRGADVVTVTLSVEQAKLARQRVARAGLTGSVDVRVQDYRDVTGRYDAIVSVEMVEAVGVAFWPQYFRVLDDRLAPGGRVGLQAILMSHARMLATRHSWTWIHKYVFPGGLIPSEQAVDEVLAAHTTLRVTDRLHFGLSYAETLRRWRERFVEMADEVEGLGFDETFRRMWTFYLAYCEAGFRAGYLDVGQLVLDRRG